MHRNRQKIRLVPSAVKLNNYDQSYSSHLFYVDDVSSYSGRTCKGFFGNINGKPEGNGEIKRKEASPIPSWTLNSR